MTDWQGNEIVDGDVVIFYKFKDNETNKYTWEETYRLTATINKETNKIFYQITINSTDNIDCYIFMDALIFEEAMPDNHILTIKGKSDKEEQFFIEYFCR